MPAVAPLGSRNPSIQVVLLPSKASSSQNEKYLYLAIKISLYVLVTSSLVAGAILSAGTANAMLAGGLSVAKEVGAYYGLSLGLSIAALLSVPNAIYNRMFSYTGKDKCEIMTFLGIQAAITSICASLGSILGSLNGFSLARIYSGQQLSLIKENEIFLMEKGPWLYRHLANTDLIANWNNFSVTKDEFGRLILRKFLFP